MAVETKIPLWRTLAEHGRLMAMGAVPVPSAEQLRRERPDNGLPRPEA